MKTGEKLSHLKKGREGNHFKKETEGNHLKTEKRSLEEGNRTKLLEEERMKGYSPASEFYMPTFRNTLSVPSS